MASPIVRFEAATLRSVFPNPARSAHLYPSHAFFHPTAFTSAPHHPCQSEALELPPLILNTCCASVDGTVLIGTATDADFALKTFVLRVPASVYED